jgi:hypothetical protein
MKTMKLFAALFIVPLLFTSSCKKEGGGSAIDTGRMTVRMMDGPSPYGYEEVNIDVQSVDVHIAGSTGGDWYRLHTRAGIYNVLTLVNGIDTLLADETVVTGQITSMRLNLGTNNSLRLNGTLYPLTIPSGEESGLKVEIHENIGAEPLRLFIDFDAGQSIVNDGHGSYHLKPVIRAFTTMHTGTVTGGVSLPGPGIAVTLSNGTQLFTTYVEAQSGRFMLRGLTPGTYSATVYSANAETFFTNIVVSEHTTTDVGIWHIQ